MHVCLGSVGAPPSRSLGISAPAEKAVSGYMWVASSSRDGVIQCNLSYGSCVTGGRVVAVTGRRTVLVMALL